MNEEDSTQSNRSGVWLSATPIAIGGTLALVYALGAIAVYGQLRHAGLNATQTMPLVPIEQILGRGIGSIVSIFGRAIFNFFLAALTVAGLWSDRHNAYVNTRRTGRGGR